MVEATVVTLVMCILRFKEYVEVLLRCAIAQAYERDGSGLVPGLSSEPAAILSPSQGYLASNDRGNVSLKYG